MVDRPITLVWNISTTIGSIEIRFGTDIHGAQMVNPHDVGDPLTCPLMPPAGQSFHLSSKIYQHLIDGMAQKWAQNIHGSQMMNPNDFGDPLTFPVAPPWGYWYRHPYLSKIGLWPNTCKTYNFALCLVQISNYSHAKLICECGKHYIFKPSVCLHCHCKHVSMLMLAFSSKHYCAWVQPHTRWHIVYS